MKMVGAFKLTFAIVFFVMIAYPEPTLTRITAAGLVVLMVVALYSHFKVGDAITRYIPATFMLVFSAFILCVGAPPPPIVIDPVRVCIGSVVGAVCFAMFVQSFLSG